MGFFLEIQAYRKTPVGRLPYGLQKRVDLARALAMEPKLLLLDEPMAGMNVEEKQDMCRFILDVNDQFGTTIVLIDALYSGKTSQFIETQVKFEDGRTGKVSADLRIEEAKVFAAGAEKRAA